MAGGVYGMFGAAAAQKLAAGSPAPAASSTSTSALDLKPTSGVSAADWADVAAAPSAMGRMLDLVFVMDATGSMGSYIIEATHNIEVICDSITQSDELRGAEALRIALIAYRDHPPQDKSYVTRTFPFTTSVEQVKENLHSLYASGGGDGPEAVTAALAELVALPWRPEATKLAVLITDAPPHGLGERGDGFPQGSPDNYDPLHLGHIMARQGIGLLMVACEPILSAYHYAVDFFRALVQITGGTCVPLTTASLLSHVIVAAAAEAMDLERLHRDIGEELMNRLHSLSLNPNGANASLDDIARELHSKLLLREESTKQLYIESIYNDSAEANHNASVLVAASSLQDARPLLRPVPQPRLNSSYRQTRRANTSFRSVGATNTITPPRTDRRTSHAVFESYSADPSLCASVSPPNSAPGLSFSPTSPIEAWGSSIRQQRPQAFIDSDEEQDMELEASALPQAVATASGALEVAGSDGQKLLFGQAPMSLDQARRLAWQSAQRSGLAA